MWAQVRKIQNVATKVQAILKNSALVNETNKVALVIETPCIRKLMDGQCDVSHKLSITRKRNPPQRDTKTAKEQQEKRFFGEFFFVLPR